MAFLPRFLVAVCLLSTRAMASSSRLWKDNIFVQSENTDTDNDTDNDMDSVVSLDSSLFPVAAADDAIVAEMIANAKIQYESLREDYIREGCPETWGEFPTSPNTERPSIEAIKINGGFACKCGLIHDLAASEMMVLLFEAENENHEEQRGQSTDSIRASQEESNGSRLDSLLMARTATSKTECSANGVAAGYPCKNVDLIAYVPLSTLNAQTANDVWGWTHGSSGREFVIWGVDGGHYFFEVDVESDPVLLGYLKSTKQKKSNWHDVKVVGDFCYMGSESKDHGMQIFDLKQLLTINPETDCVSDKYCTQLSPGKLYTGDRNHPVGNSHNIVANAESNFVYIVGGKNGCGGGLHAVDVSNPLNPTFAGCFGDEGYVHDAQCVNYNGADDEFNDREICFCFNGNAVAIVDVTDKSDMKKLSKTAYAGFAYTHQGWLSSDQSHLVFGDEVDELEGHTNGKTRTLIFNVEDLRDPNNLQEYAGTTSSIDHNQYIASNNNGIDLVYQANYRSGLRIQQVLDYETGSMEEVGYFDTYPLSNSANFNGAWSIFPFFPSGLVAISSIGEGLFLVKPNLRIEEEAVPSTSPTISPSDVPSTSPTVSPAVPSTSPTNSPSDVPSTASPTVSPTANPTASDDCADQPIQWQNKKNRDCNWVGQPSKIRNIRKRCRKKWMNQKPKDFCLKTCGEVGLGDCKHLQNK